MFLFPYRGTDKLDVRWHAKDLEIENLLTKYNMPFKRYETWRSVERQAYLYDNNKSKIRDGGKHGMGLATDWVLFIDGKWSWGARPTRKQSGATDSEAIRLNKRDISLYWAKAYIVSGQIDGVACGSFWANFVDHAHHELVNI